MGNICKRCMKIRLKNNLPVIVLGLDNAGKTEIAHKVCKMKRTDKLATQGCKVYEAKLGKLDVSLIELGGGPNIRGIWKYYLLEAYGVIYVIDSCDLKKMEDSKNILRDLLTNPHLEGKPFLILGNKQDLPGALDYLDIFYYFGLEEMANSYQSPCMLEVTGNFVDTNGYSQMEVALDWFTTAIIHREKTIRNTITFFQQLEDLKSEFSNNRPATAMKKHVKKMSKKAKVRPSTAPNINYKINCKNEQNIPSPLENIINVSVLPITKLSPVLGPAQSHEYLSDNPDPSDKSSKNFTEVKVQVHREDENSPRPEFPLLNHIQSITAKTVPNPQDSNDHSRNQIAVTSIEPDLIMEDLSLEVVPNGTV